MTSVHIAPTNADVVGGQNNYIKKGLVQLNNLFVQKK
jgi:hypothetical protein